MTGPQTGGRPLGAGSPASKQITYLPVYELVSPLLGDPDVLPGTPVWCQLEDTDPAKWKAILWAAVWWCVEQDARQAAMAEASKAIAASADWSAVAQRVRNGRGPAYIKRKEVA
jgi:hypothetical protein